MRRKCVLVRPAFLAMVAVSLFARIAAGDEPAGGTTDAKPPWQRLLHGEDAKKAKQLEAQIAKLTEAEKFADALKVAENLAELRGKLQGADHYQAVGARWDEVALQRVLKQGKEAQAEYAALTGSDREAGRLEAKANLKAALPLREKALAVRRKALGEDHPATATSYEYLANNQYAQGKFALAEEGFQKALAIRRKALGDEHPDTATSYHRLAVSQVARNKHFDAEQNYRAALNIRRKALGEDHSDTTLSRNNLAVSLSAQGKYAEAEEGLKRVLSTLRKTLGNDHLVTAQIYNNLASNQQFQGKYAQAEEGHRKALAIRRKVLGENHPDTATSYNDLAVDLKLQGKYAEAEEGCRKALAINRKALGDDHPATATSFNNLADCHASQGKYAEAEEGYAKALAINRKALGEDHPATATSFNNLAGSQRSQGKYARAEEGCRKALAINRKALGDDHPATALSYTNLAQTLHAQGSYAEAEEVFLKALTINRKALGDDHPDTAASYNNLAANQEAQGKYAEAEEGLRKAIAIYRKVLGDTHLETANAYGNLALDQKLQGKAADAEEALKKTLSIRRNILGDDHPDTATSYNNLAANQEAQGKSAQAEENHQKALAVWRKALGDEHPNTASGYLNLAYNRQVQGKFALAEEGYRKALDIRRKTLGDDHPDTADCYTELAFNQNAQGKFAEAEELWGRAATSFARARLRLARTGLDRAAKTGERSPLTALSAALARNGKRRDAWLRYEESLARGTWEDLSVRLRRGPAEQAELTELVARLERLDQLVERAIPHGDSTPEQKKRRDDLLAQRRQAQNDLDVSFRRLEQTYGPAAGQVFDCTTIQAALRADAALVGWLDLPGAVKDANPDGEHWAFVLRATGEPVVVHLKGTGPGGRWVEADTNLPADLRSALLSPAGDWKPLADRLRRQRLGPLAEHLAAGDGRPAVRHLIVLPSTALAGVPAEAFADGFTVSYALSGTLFAHLHKQHRPAAAGLLAVADPVFDRPAVAEVPPPPLPPGGALVTSVIAGGNAAQAGLKAGDVLLRYNGATLAARGDLKAVPESGDAAQQVPVAVWRDGKTFDKELRPGKLGVVLANEPAPQALAAKYEGDRIVAKLRGGDDGDLPALPGTRVEAEGLRKLFAAFSPEPLVLAGSEASEQRLYDLAKSGDLGKYRYLHLATHGIVDDRFPLRSAIILARDRLPDPDKQLDAGLPVFDGRLTAEEVLRQWHLNADLVTLSACQTALGKYERGEGFVGFAQALLLAGSRSVCLSLWKVDDNATALLMGRFYENLLGKRAGLKGPMGKAAALAEAKAWLAGLSGEAALKAAAAMSDGVARGPRPALPKSKAAGAPAAADGDRPYAHPYYWAAFVLIGDPD